MNTDDIVFNPVVVNRGRKFRGRGYEISGGYTYTRGYSGSGVDPYQAVDYARIWDPETKKIAYANADFLEPDASVAPDRRASDLAEYVKSTIDEQIAYCTARTATENDALQWARNSLLKRHPEMRVSIDARLPDRRDVVAETERTLQWASNLKSRPCTVYGRHCAGGKPYADQKKIRIALDVLERKGVAALDGFAEVFELLVVNSGMKCPADVKSRIESLKNGRSEKQAEPAV